MTLPRPRFTLRWLMVAVAIVGSLTGAEELRRRAARFRIKAENHTREAASERSWESWHRRQAENAPDWAYPDGAEQAESSGKWAAYDEKMSAKYARAARYPWLPVEPDPPEPE